MIRFVFQFFALSLAIFSVDAAQAQAPRAAVSPLFSSDEPLDITIKTSMDFKAYYDGERPRGNDQFPAEISYEFAGKKIVSEVVVSPRGKSRLQDCHFAPFKVLFDGTNNGPLFAGAGKSIKFVPRCGREPNLSLDEKMLYKEILIYKMVEATGIPAFKVRLVNVHYQNEQGWATGHEKAFIIETKKLILARESRLVRAMTDAEILSLRKTENKDPQHDPEMRATHELIQNMIENFDWDDGVFGAFQNVEAFMNTSGKVVMVPYDFDRTVFVGHEVEMSEGSPHHFMKFLRNNCFEAICRVAAKKLILKRDSVLKSIADFKQLSNENKAELVRHTQNFFEALAQLK